MDSLFNQTFHGIDPPFLQNLQGWKIFLCAIEIEPHCWRGCIRIERNDSPLVGQLCCTIERGGEAEALQDAKDFALATLNRIDERLHAAGVKEFPQSAGASH